MRCETDNSERGRQGRTSASTVALAFALVVTAAASQAVHAQRVYLRPPETPVQPGEVFTLWLVIEGARNVPPPTLADIPGLTGEQQPSSRRTEIVNFQSTSRFGYRMMALQPGTVTIPKIPVHVDGKTIHTPPVQIRVSKPQAQDVLIAEIATSHDEVFVEQPFELTLRVWVRVFKQGTITLSAEDMQGLLSNESDFGIFQEELAEEKIRIREGVRRPDVRDPDATYYVCEVAHRVIPEKPGPYKAEPVVLRMNYPIKLGRDRFGRLGIARRRSVFASPKLPTVVVKPVPQQGRPETYNGAIGRYTWRVWPDRTEVRRGQLITLNMEISGEGLLERLPAPPLEKVDALRKHFKVLEEDLAGEVKDGKKLFRKKVRAIDASATRIPSLPLTFFDPQADGGKGKFVTVMSDPIAINVVSAETLSSEDIILPTDAASGQSHLLTEAADSVRANFTEPEQVLGSQVFAPRPAWGAAVALPPVVWLIGWIVRLRSDRLRSDVALARRRGAYRSADRRLAAASQSEDPAGTVAEALLSYVADRANLPAGGMTRPDAVRRLRDNGVADGVVQDVDAVLADCEVARYGGMASGSDTLLQRARECLRQLEKQWKA